MYERSTDSHKSTKSKKIHTTAEASDSQRMGAYGQPCGSSPEASDSSNEPISVGESTTARGPDVSERQASQKGCPHQGTGGRKPETERSAGVSDPGADVVKKKDELGLTNRCKGDSYSGTQRVRISESHASTIWQRYKKEGSSAIKLGKRGRRHGQKRSFLPEEEKQIQRCLIDKTPEQLKLSFALWTRDAVRLLIKSHYGISMPIRTVGEYLKRWGFTPQKPIKRAYEQNSQAVKQWLETRYPAIARQAKKEKA